MNRPVFSATLVLMLAWASSVLPLAMAQGRAAPLVDEAPLRAYLSLLASDLFEGRGTGQRGGDLTVAYLETQARVLGLQAAGPGGSYRQSVRLLGSRTLPASSRLQLEGGAVPPLRLGADWVFGAGNGQALNGFDDELVFAGYGISAPEERWDDFKGQDLRGKILIVLANDPYPTEAEPDRFAGKAMTVYGRRGYKIEEAQRRGAKGVLVLHTEASTLVSWSVISQGSMNEQFQLDKADKRGLPLQGWLSEEAAGRLFAAAGQDLEALRALAQTRDFKPVALGIKLKGELHTQLRNLEQFNVAGLIPGTDPVLKDELVIYTAHWDHLGRQSNERGESLIFNGAVDNASGTAALLAMAQAAVRHPAKRTQMFLWVAAEEQGLLGSAWYTTQPLWPLAKTAANLNLDTLNFVGRTRDIGTYGAERSDLGPMAAQVAAQMGLGLSPPRIDVGGFFFRSDHFSFAKAGVPAFSVSSGSQYLDSSPEVAEKRRAFGIRYHQPSDQYDPSWDLSGMREQAQYTLNLGRAVADAERMPVWRSGDPFGAVVR